MKVLSHFLPVAAVLGAAAASLAQAPLTEVKGVREFTGKLIVQPYTPTELTTVKGMSAAAARTGALQAWLKIESLVIRQDPEVGQAVVRVPSGSTEAKLAASLMATGLFKSASPDWRVFPVKTPNDPLFSSQWHHQKIQSEAGWNYYTGGTNIVAICDTGCELDHPDLKAGYIPGFNAPDNKSQTSGGDVSDVHGHGTHVAGCAAARGNNGLGVAGVTWSARIMPIRITNDPAGYASEDDIDRGIRWAADNGAKIISLSFSGVQDPLRETTGAYARGKGALFCNAAGNDSANLNFDWPDVFIVGASSQSDGRVDFSAYGKGIDVFAPGVSILSTVRGHSYEAWDGTSMATPLVSGLMTLIWSYVPSLTSYQVEGIVTASCDNIGPEGIFGSGRINVKKAMALASTYLTEVKVFAPSSATVTTGSYKSGSLASLGAKDAGFYVVNSASIPGAGHAAVVTAGYSVGTPSKVLGFELDAVCRTNSGQAMTGSLFLYNNATGKTDLVASAPLATMDRALAYTVSAENASKYIASNGTVKAVIRAYAADSRLTGAAVPFVCSIDQLTVKANVKK